MGLSLATFNVKDLLPPASDAARAALPAKLDWVARMLRTVDADVVGLQEVGSAELLGAVAERMGSPGLHRVMGTTDARGIGCALLSRLPLLDTRVHTAESLAFPVFVAGDAPPFGTRIPLRRGIVHARVDSPVGPVDVLVAHFKSSRPVGARDTSNREMPPRTSREAAEASLRSLVWRAAEALHVRGLVDEILAARPGTRVAVVGDFNDVPDSAVLRCLRGAGEGPRANGVTTALADCTSGVDPARRFSCFHGEAHVQIDHALATESLRALLVSARFFNDALRLHGKGDELAPDSDHAPLLVRFG